MGRLTGRRPLGASELAANLDAFLEEGRLFLLFDALNEMPQTGFKERSRRLRQFIDAWSEKGNRFLVTCRALDYGEELAGLQRIEIQPLTDEQIQGFIQNELAEDWTLLWQALTEQQNHQRRLLDMARNPYVLTIMIDVFSEDGRLGQNRAELMDRSTQILMAWAKEKCPPEQWIDATAQQTSLATLAFEAQKQGGFGTLIETEKVKALMPSWAQPESTRPPVPTPPEQVLSLAASAKIIEMPVDRSSVRFYHQLLQEYFAAQELLNRLKQQPEQLTALWQWPWLEAATYLPRQLSVWARWGWAKLRSRATEMPRWQRLPGNYDPLPPPPATGWEETTILAAGLALENDHQFIKHLTTINPVLAGRCLHEGRARVDAATRQG